MFEIKYEQPIISTNSHVFFITEISVEIMYLHVGSDRFKNPKQLHLMDRVCALSLFWSTSPRFEVSLMPLLNLALL